jgi:hypothetical protein
MSQVVYSIPDDFGVAEPRIDQLQTEIVDSGISSAIVQYINREDDSVIIFFDAVLIVGDKSILDTLVANHIPVPNPVISQTLAVLVPRRSEFKSSLNTRVVSFVYDGTSSTATITGILLLAYMDKGLTNYTITVKDASNKTDISSETFTNVVEESVILDVITNLPEKRATLEVFVKSNDGSKSVYIDSVTIVGICI